MEHFWGQQQKSKMAEQGQKTIIGVFLQILPSLCFETNPIKFYGKEKHNAKILSIYLSKFDKRSQNYRSIKVDLKWYLRNNCVFAKVAQD